MRVAAKYLGYALFDGVLPSSKISSSRMMLLTKLSFDCFSDDCRRLPEATACFLFNRLRQFSRAILRSGKAHPPLFISTFKYDPVLHTAEATELDAYILRM